jgi:hypothetical protein
MKYGRLVVSIRHDYAEIWRFKYELTLVIGTLKIIASTGVFVRVVFALNHSIKNLLRKTKHDFDLSNAYIKPQPPKDVP